MTSPYFLFRCKDTLIPDSAEYQVLQGFQNRIRLLFISFKMTDFLFQLPCLVKEEYSKSPTLLKQYLQNQK